jgi:hypothetical protein
MLAIDFFFFILGIKKNIMRSYLGGKRRTSANLLDDLRPLFSWNTEAAHFDRDKKVIAIDFCL